MKVKIYVIIATILVFSSGCTGFSTETDLRSELLEIGRRDQDVRVRVVAFVREREASMDTPEFRALVGEQNAVDEANFVRLEEIVSEQGWPSVKMVGQEANDAAWLVLEHANIERQRRFLSMLRETVSLGRAEADKLAGLEDEVALSDNGFQIYGTEISVDLINRKAALKPVADPSRLDERRASIGLPPIEVYLREAEAQLGMPVDLGALSIE